MARPFNLEIAGSVKYLQKSLDKARSVNQKLQMLFASYALLVKLEIANFTNEGWRFWMGLPVRGVPGLGSFDALLLLACSQPQR